MSFASASLAGSAEEMMTKIIFDSNGKPHWFNFESGAWLHNVDHYQALAMADAETRVQYTSEDYEWFRKPLGRGSIES